MAENNAGSELIQWSQPFFVENTPAQQGTIFNGRSWAENLLFQPYNDTVSSQVMIITAYSNEIGSIVMYYINNGVYITFFKECKETIFSNKESCSYKFACSGFQIDVTVAISYLGKGLNCPLQDPLIDEKTFNDTW